MERIVDQTTPAKEEPLVIGGIVVEETTEESRREFWGGEFDDTIRYTGLINHCAEEAV